MYFVITDFHRITHVSHVACATAVSNAMTHIVTQDV